MALIPTKNPRRDLARRRSLWSFDNDFRRMMDAMLARDVDWPVFGELQTWAGESFPKVDMKESDDAIIVTAELPGIEVDDVKLEVTDHSLMISGEKKSETEKGDDEKGWHCTERSYGWFRRVLPLPANVDSDKVEASFHNGVLTIKMSKLAKETAKGKTIPIAVD